MSNAHFTPETSLEDRGLLELARDLDPMSIGVGVVVGAVATSITTFLFVIRPMKRELDQKKRLAETLAMAADDFRERWMRNVSAPPVSSPPMAVRTHTLVPETLRDRYPPVTEPDPDQFAPPTHAAMRFLGGR